MPESTSTPSPAAAAIRAREEAAPESILPDTRIFADQPAKNEFLLAAQKMLERPASATAKAAADQAAAELRFMLETGSYLSFSVALQMAGGPRARRALWSLLDDAYRAINPGEWRIDVWPVVAAVGADKPAALSRATPAEALRAFLGFHWFEAAANELRFWPRLLTAQDFARLSPDAWYAMKSGPEAMDRALAGVPDEPVAAGDRRKSEAVALFAVGALPRRESHDVDFAEIYAKGAMDLMQIWNRLFSDSGATVFSNPLAPMPPAAAFVAALGRKKRLEADIFAANAVRAARLAGAVPCAAIAGREGGRLAFLLYAQNGAVSPFAMDWHLEPDELVEEVARGQIRLWQDIGVERIRVLSRPLFSSELPPAWGKIENLNGLDVPVSGPSDRAQTAGAEAS